MPTILEEYINLTAKVVKEGKNRLYFQIVNPIASLTKEKIVELLNYNFVMQLEDRVLPINKIFNKIKGKNAKTKYLTKENQSLMCTIFKQNKTNFKIQIILLGFKHTFYFY